MRLAALAVAVLALAACGEVGSGVLSGGVRPTPVATALPTPTPDIALRLMDQVRNMTAEVRRVDRISAVQAKWGDQLKAIQMFPAQNPNEDVWVIAVVGDVAPGFGRGGFPEYQCATYVYDSQGNPKSHTASALSGCAPYFSDSLVPAPAPVRCPPEPQGYSYDGHGPASLGPVPLVTSRDDSWHQPLLAPGIFLYDFAPGSYGYYETFCRVDQVITPLNESQAAEMLVGLGSPSVTASPGKAQIWLKDLHALEAMADGNSVKVVVERRTGFEIASFDWASVKRENNTYVRFDYVDRSGNPVIPFRIANGP